MKVFLGILVNKKGEILHSHVSMSPDDSFVVNITFEDVKFRKEYRKWHHFVDDFKNFTDLHFWSLLKEVNTHQLFKFLVKQSNASIF